MRKINILSGDPVKDEGIQDGLEETVSALRDARGDLESAIEKAKLVTHAMCNKMRTLESASKPDSL